ncbi:hypothetical protein Csp2054_04050 [Curtobacterium sp. 'Ferrero']|uniref:DUF4232 domain-containing protein n=1 Tax=Curtobacterium sp. 'Ferrero' TaxID=2033654 RepID=UPI000BD51B27|nr:DUF4232 domain-containing protein [Curtobacterium sp. 'Ferrero']PCN48763.1 hypothetical protein Csp2054_04050 [Curtobacterium sp. 'Ferrero']
MTTRAWRSTAFAGAATIVALVALAGCAGTASVQAGPTTTTAPSATTTPDPTSGATTAHDASSASSPAAASGSGGTSSGTGTLRSSRCAATDLQGSLTAAAGGGSAGHQAYDIVFRNTGSSSCTLQGWPGVSFVGKGNGTQLGAPAVLDRSSAHGTVTIAAGSVAHATVLVAEAGNYGDCGAVTADGFRVYPPGSKRSLFVDAGQLQLSACTATSADQLQVQAVQPGS